MVKINENFNSYKIGLFDSGIGGYSVLGELFTIMPEASYYYISDDGNAPYGPKSDEFITERAFFITEELLSQGVALIVVACNTATAASIDKLREKFKTILFVGVEPYLNAYYKMPEGLLAHEKKMMVLTTESTGKSERFKRLKERLDPDSQIDHYSLKNLAKFIEEYYYHPEHKLDFEKKIEEELFFLKEHRYFYAILGCTHYPLIKDKIEKNLNLKTISPCLYVAQRVLSLAGTHNDRKINDKHFAVVEDFFYYLSTSNNIWTEKKRESLYGPFKGNKHVKN